MPGTVSSDTRQDDMVKAFDLKKSPKIVRRHHLRGLQFVLTLEKTRISKGNQSDFLTDDDEVSALITEEVRKSLSHSDAFISDTGCTNDMTDQRRLFISDLTPIPRRWIKVGGGRLFSDFKGDVLLRCPDGSSGILPDALLVDGLGVNLLSAKKMCQRNNAKGSFDEKRMLFHDIDNNIILSALLHDGLYKVDHIAGPNERALCSQDLSPSPDVDMKIMEYISNTTPTDAEIVDDEIPVKEVGRTQKCETGPYFD
ncbi:hypothetical protein K3495_g5620 [Podosphaera aphanis]|nr:hypothetical protein K3495_g5620 [Podosphaera aphanis]